MPRPLIYSNGRLFLGIDGRCRIRDLFYPQVGLYNHLSGHAIRMGVWTDGAFSWVDEDGWNRELSYETGSAEGRILLSHPAFGVEIECRDRLDRQTDVFRRRIAFQSTYGTNRSVRLYFTHDLHIAETDIGDTAFFNPFLSGVVHYKGPHCFLFRATSGREGAIEYATGIKGFNGFEGTWRDAEDGKLSMNPIAQGSVDSTLGIELELDAQGSAVLQYEIFAADSLAGLQSLAGSLSGEGSHEPAKQLKDAPVYKALDPLRERLPDEIFELCRRSLHVIEAHCDRHGAILAAADSDIMTTNRANYCYCWPRDGSHVCMVLDRLGLHELTRPFFRFCARALSDRHPFLLQKYRPDGTLGATWHPWIVDGHAEVPFQEDESASVLHALGGHFERTKDESLLEELYPSLVLPMADFLADYRSSGSGLPKPSYDLWEERRGAHLYTASAVYAGLRAAASMANRVSDPRAFDYQEASVEIQRAIVDRFVQIPEGFFCRSIASDGALDTTADASTLFLGLFGVIDPNDPTFERHVRHLRNRLWLEGPVGGLARYEGDYYFRTREDVPGNPWIICTMWLAQCQIARAQSSADLEEPLELMRWAWRLSGPTNILPEQVHPADGSPLSVSPLVWSHSEFLKTALDWSERLAGL